MEYSDIREQLLTSFDPEDICKVLEITPDDLVERFGDRITEMAYKFRDDE